MKHLVTLLSLVCALCASVQVHAQAKLTVTMDSATVTMGRVTPYHIELLAPESPKGRLVIPKDSLNEFVEIADVLKADTTHPGDGRVEIKQTLMLQSFDSGLYSLKPILYILGNETIESERLPLKVDPVNVDSLKTIHDYADIAKINRHFVDYLPDFIVDYGLWILAIIIALGIIAGVIWYGRRRKKGIPLVKAKVIPPYDEAVAALNVLHEEKLCDQGREKEFYTRLTDILRIYLERRFGINAMEMTTRQILRQLESQESTKLPRRYMDEVLKTADFVKFAKVRPLPDDNVKAFKSALQFVEDTRPQEQPTPNNQPDATR